MKQLFVAEETTKLSWRPVSYRVIRTDQNSTVLYSNYIDALIDAVKEPILILDLELNIRSVNKALLKKFKLAKKKTVGRPLFQYSEGYPQIIKLIKQLQRLSKKNSFFKEYELKYPFQALGERTLLINAKRVHFDNEHQDVLLIQLEDITQHKLLSQQKDDFVGYVTHELKTPITSLSAFIQLLQGYHAKTGDKKSQFLLAKASGQLDRLTKLLNSFTHVYQAQTGKMELHKEKLNLYELIRDTVEMFQYITTTHTISIDGVIGRPVTADKERLRQVVINLLINAIKYSPDADTIVVKLREDTKHITVSVQDFGQGIPKEIQSRIFERFFRVRDNQPYNAKGLGLGLYISLEIIKAHKGKMWVESAEGGGSTFSFTLPSTPAKRTP